MCRALRNPIYDSSESDCGVCPPSELEGGVGLTRSLLEDCSVWMMLIMSLASLLELSFCTQFSLQLICVMLRIQKFIEYLPVPCPLL